MNIYELKTLLANKNYDSGIVSYNEGEKLGGYNIMETHGIWRLFLVDDVYSMDLNNVNDSGKRIANVFPFLDYDLSGNYENIDVNGNPLNSWWTGGTANDACGTVYKWAENYNSDEQKAIREALKVRNEANK